MASQQFSDDRPLVSVVMPCFNAQATVDEVVQSIIGQSYPNWELLALDDGSADETLPRLARWSDAESRMRVLARRHEGLISTLNAGLEAAQGDLMARMDADDISEPERLEAQVRWLECHPETAMVSCLVEAFPREDVRRGFEIYVEWLNSLVTHADIHREIFIESPVAHPSAMLRRSWIERLGGYQDHGWPEDYDLWLRMHLAGGRMEKIPRMLLRWRERPDRATRSDSRYSVKNFLRAKAHYLMKGPLAGRDALVIWGAGQMGRRLSKHLLEAGAPLRAFVDVDPAKVGRRKRGRPVIGRDQLLEELSRHQNPAVLAAVSSRGARAKIREFLEDRGLTEGQDWWAAA